MAPSKEADTAVPEDQPPPVNQLTLTADTPPPAAAERAICEAEFATTLDVLQRIAVDRGQLVRFDSQQQTRLLQLAGQVAHPGRAAKRQLNRANRAQRRAEVASQRQRDEQRLEHTGIRQLQRISARRLGAGQPPAPTSEVPRPPDESHVDPAHVIERLEVARNCYICKRDFDPRSQLPARCGSLLGFSWPGQLPDQASPLGMTLGSPRFNSLEWQAPLNPALPPSSGCRR